MKNIKFGLCLILVLMLLMGCQAQNTGASIATGTTIEETTKKAEAETTSAIKSNSVPTKPGTYVLMKIKDKGEIVVKMNPEAAPLSVENFTKLAANGFYDGLIFHRVISDFMIQGGDPTGTGSGGSEQTIKGEFSSNGVDNPLSHMRGVISMARSNDLDSASSQFFIVHQDSQFLDGNYAAFGEVVSGMDIVDVIANVKTNAADKPVEDQVIESMEVMIVD